MVNQAVLLGITVVLSVVLPVLSQDVCPVFSETAGLPVSVISTTSAASCSCRQTSLVRLFSECAGALSFEGLEVTCTSNDKCGCYSFDGEGENKVTGPSVNVQLLPGPYDADLPNAQVFGGAAVQVIMNVPADGEVCTVQLGEGVEPPAPVPFTPVDPTDVPATETPSPSGATSDAPSDPAATPSPPSATDPVTSDKPIATPVPLASASLDPIASSEAAATPVETNPVPTTSSSESEEEPEEEDGAVCVEASSIPSTYAPFLVHDRHMPATVLCVEGSDLPCGTKFHSLIVDGVRSSYGELCNQVSCFKKRAVVNAVFNHRWTDTTYSVSGSVEVVLAMGDSRVPQMVYNGAHFALDTVRQAKSLVMMQTITATKN